MQINKFRWLLSKSKLPMLLMVVQFGLLTSCASSNKKMTVEEKEALRIEKAKTDIVNIYKAYMDAKGYKAYDLKAYVDNKGKDDLPFSIVMNGVAESLFYPGEVRYDLYSGEARLYDIVIIPEIVKHKTNILSEKCRTKKYDKSLGYNCDVSCEQIIEFKIQIADSTGKTLFLFKDKRTGKGFSERNYSYYNNEKSAREVARELASISAIAKTLDEIMPTVVEEIYKNQNIRLVEAAKHIYKDDAQSNTIVLMQKNDKATKLAGNPFQLIQNLTQEKVDKYLTPRKPFDVNSQDPPTVNKPELPPAPKLVKSQFETKAVFEQKVLKAMEERDNQIWSLQEKYRKDVEERNLKVEKLRQAYAADVEAIKKEQESKKTELPKKVLEFTKEAFYEVMGEPVFGNLRYDAEAEILHMDFTIANTDYKKSVTLKVPAQVAESIHKNINLLSPLAIFILEDNSIKLKEIKALYDRNIYVATLTDKQFVPEKIEVALKDTKVDFKADQQVNLKLQNPNLNDQYRVSAISYGESAQAYGKNYNDDLTPLVNGFPAKPIDPKKWLFMIAVENYDETDKVIFAKNSAEAFKKIAQKAFGIAEQNTISLIDDKATGQAIVGKLDYFLKERLKEGDSIYFYYSGHGVPDNDSGESFILPKDNIPDYIAKEERFKLANIYKQLSDSKASKIIAFIDACFSGRTDAGQMFKGTAPALSRTKTVKFDESKMTVLSAAGNNQYANAFDEKGHRMFSYYLVKTLAASMPDSMELLFKRVSADVHDASSPKGPARLQDPQISGNVKIGL